MIPKPPKGSATAARRRRKAQQARREDWVMAQAKARDGHRCRACGVPGVEGAHLRHRGMGGNPSGDRTTRDGIVSLCPGCHRKFDGRDGARLEVECLTPARADGPLRIGGLTSYPVWFILTGEVSDE